MRTSVGELGSIRVLPPLLLAAACAFGVSLVLPWHQRWVPAAGAYRTVHGSDGATWVIGGIALCLALAVCFRRRSAGFFTKMGATLATLLMSTGIVVDYLNWQAAAAAVSAGTRAYVGPGFFTALAATGLLLVTTVLCWRWVRSW